MITHIPSNNPPPGKCTKYCTKAFGGRAPTGLLEGVYSASPDLLAGVRGKKGKGRGEEGGEEKGERNGSE